METGRVVQQVLGVILDAVAATTAWKASGLYVWAAFNEPWGQLWGRVAFFFDNFESVNAESLVPGDCGALFASAVRSRKFWELGTPRAVWTPLRLHCQASLDAHRLGLGLSR